MTDLAVAALGQEFTEAAQSTEIGGARILQELGRIADRCIDGSNATRDAVAFALSMVFAMFASDRVDRAVTVAETQRLRELGVPRFAKAIQFLKMGGSAEEAVGIIAALC